ncbi:MAG: hypothetical protein M3483_02090 [Gemmatimonadota bacterium]|nr:hypothetical protein [Gemmatimonadota bacterium]
MAEIGVATHGDVDPLFERTGFRLSWGAIFAGFVIATAVQMVLSTLGVAIGMSAFNPGDGDSASGLGIAVAIWFALTAMVSLFIGGLVTGRLAGILTRNDGRLHGVVLWGLSTLLAVYFASIGLGRLTGGVFDLVTGTTAAVAGGVAGSAGQIGAAAIDRSGDIDFGALQREIETTLEQTENPALQPDSLQQQAQGVGAEATGGTDNEALAREITDRARATGGEIEREDAINVIMARTGMSRAEAERTATRVEDAAASVRSQVSTAADQVQEQVGEVVETGADYTARAAWAALLVMALSLGAAVFGAGRTARD